MTLREVIVSMLQALDDKQDYVVCLARIGHNVTFEIETFAEGLCDSLNC
ncbi:hypothetical protein [Pantoea eucrina]|nr:hypothetical protein [Pantoea eucrina]